MKYLILTILFFFSFQAWGDWIKDNQNYFYYDDDSVIKKGNYI